MGDSEKVITYTPEENAEISRILAAISSGPGIPGGKTDIPPARKPDSVMKQDEQREEYFGEPEDLDLPTGDLEKAVPTDEFDEDLSSGEESFSDEDLSLSDDEASLADSLDLGEDVLSDAGAALDEELKLDESDLEEISSEDLKDISDFVQVEEEPAIPEEPEEPAVEPKQKLTEKLAEKFAEKFPRKPKKGTSALDQLSALTADEPESLDSQDISDERFTDETPAREPEAEKPSGAEDEFADLDSIDFGETPVETKPGRGPKKAEVSLEKEADMDIPDLEDISLSECRPHPGGGSR